jgi:hypothetical protein
MATPATAPPVVQLQIHSLNDQYTKVHDRTKEAGITISGDHPAEIVWQGLPFVWVNPDDQLCKMVYSRNDYTDLIVISNGRKPGRIELFEQELQRDKTKPALAWTIEINTRILTSRTKSIESNGSQTEVKAYYLIARTLKALAPSPAETEFVAAKLPVDDSKLSQSEKTLLNQVVSRVSPQTIGHRSILNSNAIYRSIFKEKVSRIHPFEHPEVFLYDCTKNKVGSVQYLPAPNCREVIALKGNPLMFIHENKGFTQGDEYSRGAPGFLSYVLLEDHGDHSVKISRKNEVTRGNSEAEIEECIIDLRELEKKLF